MRTIQNILLGLVAFTVGITTIQAENMNARKNQKSSTGGWSSIGPSNVHGRVLAIHVDINNSQKIYAGTAGSGLWVTTNNGGSWSRCSGYTGSAAVSAITQGNDGKLFIGTGEGLNAYYGNPGVITNTLAYGIKGDGVYISDDGGNTFSHVGSTSSWVAVNSMAYDKKNNKLYVATNGGLKVSSDNGNSFVDAMNNSYKTFDVKVGSDGTVICSVLSGNGDVFVSTDNGNSFHSVCGSESTKIPNSAGRISVAIAPSNPNTMYAFAETGMGTFYGVYVSYNKGEIWTKIFNEGGYDDPMRGSGAYANVVAVSPTDSTKILIGSTRLFELEKQQDTSSTEIIYRRLPRDGSLSSLTIHTIAYTEQTIYLGTSLGVFYSTNGGQTFQEGSRYLSNLQVYSMSVANDGRIIAGTRENGSIYMLKPQDSSATGSRLLNGDGGKSAFSLLKPDALFYLSLYGMGYRQASIASSPQAPDEWYKVSSLVSGAYTRWYPTMSNLRGTYNLTAAGNLTAEKPNPIASPLVMWESVSDFNSKDTILYVVEKDFAPGEDICVKSARNRYPIWITNTKLDTLHRDDTLYVHDIITSRLFLGGGPYRISSTDERGVGAPVFMSLTALNYNVDQTWTCVFRTKDTTEQVMDMVVSNDGDHLFILTQKVQSLSQEYSLYRVSGFDQYRSEIELDVSKMGHATGAGLYDANDRRMLIDDTLISNLTGEDILSITLDPQDNNNLIYTTNNIGGANPRIKMIANALTATLSTVDIKDKEGTGIPTDMPVYTSLIEMTHADIAYIGTEKGVYRTDEFTSSNPTWKLYNDGINIDVPVFQLIQQTRNFPSTYSVTYDKTGLIDTVNHAGVLNYGMIYAATHGAGIFRDTSYWQQTGSKTFIPGNKYVNNVLKVYPNPANTHFTIDYALTSSNDRVQLNVVDITGKIVYTKNLGVKDVGNHSEKLDCSNLPSGFYFVNMIIGRHNKTAKIIISK
jgi:hypothetical protein